MLLLVVGEIIFDWGNTHKKHLIHSVRKRLLNSLNGIGVAEGKIDTSKNLRELGIQDIEPKLSENDNDYDGNDIYRMLDLVFNAQLK